jgi:enterochelin esterase-like enzyme
MSLVSLVTVFALATEVASPTIRVYEVEVEGRPVVIVHPEGPGPMSLVVALPGLGEMVSGPRASARGWVDKYGLADAYRRLLAADPLFPRLAIVCPATPRDYTAAFERFVVFTLLPWAEANLDVRPGRERGIDGISAGGVHAMRIAFAHPEHFTTVGTEQTVTGGLHGTLPARLRRDPERFGHLHLHLLTSTHDPFRPKIQRLAESLEGLSVSVTLAVVPGRHDKAFARGPGAEGMLEFHARHLGKSGR